MLVVVDRFSKAYRLIPLKGLPTALETAESLFHHVFWKYGLPENIVSDRGPQFTSRVWKAFFQLLGVTVSLSSGYHPQTDGQTERKIQVLGRHLRSYCSNDLHSWSCFLPWRGGNVRESQSLQSPQSFQSSAPMFQKSQSPEF